MDCSFTVTEVDRRGSIRGQTGGLSQSKENTGKVCDRLLVHPSSSYRGGNVEESWETDIDL